MPPKVIICNICGKEVSKRQSLAYKDGRACREHEEAQNFKTETVAEKKAQDLQKKKKSRVPNHRDTLFVPHCALCGEDGLLEKEWLSIYFDICDAHYIATGKRIESQPVEARKKFFASLNQYRCLITLPWEGKIKRHRLNHNDYQVAQILGSIPCCCECMREHGLERPPRPLDKMPPDQFLDTLTKIAAAHQTILDSERDLFLNDINNNYYYPR